MEPPPPIAISAIEHYEYCPRQCALIHGDGVWEDNSHTLRGGHGHKRVDTGSDRRERGKLVLRSLPLWSARLNLSGRADVVECHDDGSLVPIEYKIGTRHGMAADLQLCAQALCLEEMTGQPVQQGYVWYSLSSLARSFVAGKLQNCRRSVQRWTWDADGDLKPLLAELQAVVEERLSNLASADDGDRIRGIEGDASRRYFRAFALHLGSQRLGMYFTGRRRRPPDDPVNALLSFTYGLMLSELTGALDAVGLDPQVGFLHRPRSGRPSLALDMLEELRPSVADRFILQLIGRKRVRAKDFTITGGACYLTEEARKLVLQAYEEYKSEEVAHQLLDRQVPRASLPLVQATLLARHLRGDIAQYPPYVAAN